MPFGRMYIIIYMLGYGHRFFVVYISGFAVSPGQPILISDDAEVVTLIGSSQDEATQINQKEIQWGVSHKRCWVPFILCVKRENIFSNSKG